MIRFATAASAVALAFVAPAAVAQTVYNDAASFNAAVPGASLEDFSTATYSGTTATTSNVTVTGIDSFFGPGFYTLPSVAGYPGSTPITFTFNSAINSFGFDIFDLGTVGTTTLTATVNGTTFDLVTDYDGNGGSSIFRGFTFGSSFTSVTIGNLEPGDFVEFDNVLFSSAVPEPATWALMILGFGAVGGAMRRRNAGKAVVRFA